MILALCVGACSGFLVLPYMEHRAKLAVVPAAPLPEELPTELTALPRFKSSDAPATPIAVTHVALAAPQAAHVAICFAQAIAPLVPALQPPLGPRSLRAVGEVAYGAYAGKGEDAAEARLAVGPKVLRALDE